MPFYYVISETFYFTREPENPTVVVEGLNITNVSLKWEFVLNQGESIQSIAFNRQKPGDIQSTQIALRLANTAFTIVNSEFFSEYRAILPATLQLLNASKNEEYLYTVEVSYTDGSGVHVQSSQVAIIVHGEY